ncbi:ISAs1 family transposase [bacterium]|nr:ISAs1 family transposase [bacterium]
MRRSRRHELFDLVVVALCGTIAGSDTWADIERFGKERLDWLRTFLTLRNGIASHDTFGRVFAMLDPAKLVECLRQWLDEVGREIGPHVAIDGKTLRGSFDKAAQKNPLHLVSAWASEARL